MTYDEQVNDFVSHSDNICLFRGEGSVNGGGMHFTPNEQWARKFAKNKIIKGYLPKNSKIKLLAEADLENGFKMGISSEDVLWDYFFQKGFDAIVGCDAMNGDIIDVIVHPKHLKNFEIMPL
jgi:hypothetical protein